MCWPLDAMWDQSRERHRQARDILELGLPETHLCAPLRAAEYFQDRTDVQCLHRWQKVLNPELVKGPWTEEVRALLPCPL